MFLSNFDSALVVGLGTGNTLRTLSLFPFRRIDVAELSPEIIEAAREWFSDVNGKVFDKDPRVQTSISDGRNYLLLSKDTYDLMTVEVTSLWVGGAGDLYNREFYELCRAHLTNAGVLQQWVALHHLRTQDFIAVLSTAAQVFPHVVLFESSDQSHGLIVASMSPLEPDYRVVSHFSDSAAIQHEVESVGIASPWSLLGEMVLGENSFRDIVHIGNIRFLGRPRFASTDFTPYLEYQAPKGIVVPYDTVVKNRAFIKTIPEGQRTQVRIRNVPSDRELAGILALASARRQSIEDEWSQWCKQGNCSIESHLLTSTKEPLTAAGAIRCNPSVQRAGTPALNSCP
jgi:spermidine synthase